jgi:hypothetical protein
LRQTLLGGIAGGLTVLLIVVVVSFVFDIRVVSGSAMASPARERNTVTTTSGDGTVDGLTPEMEQQITRLINERLSQSAHLGIGSGLTLRMEREVRSIARQEMPPNNMTMYGLTPQMEDEVQRIFDRCIEMRLSSIIPYQGCH